mmetsp:Transcript_96494/g.132887  ORF Transcript_96494/g.132887 Transcript_96494/m.132887 type:complete len:175 (-) Transcript_96494:153-677(-)
MSFLFTMMMLYMTFQRCEQHFERKQAEFVTMLLFLAATSMLFGWLADEYVALYHAFSFSVMYVWCKLLPDLQMRLYGFPVKNANLPWVVIALHILMGGSPFQDLCGVAAGHSYIFLKTVLPDSHGYDLLKTPCSIEKFVARVNAYFEEPVIRGGGRIYNLNNDARGNANIAHNG